VGTKQCRNVGNENPFNGMAASRKIADDTPYGQRIVDGFIRPRPIDSHGDGGRDDVQRTEDVPIRLATQNAISTACR
jgi:hypothetical protein